MTRWSIAGGSIGAFTVLAFLVYFGLLDNVDSIVGEWARPHDVWGPAQVRADLIVSGLRPVVLASLLAAFTLACCVRRRSLRPAMFVGGVSLVTVALTVATKTAVRRPDPHGLVTNGYGGSFPSGHMVAVVMVLALAILVVRPRPGWWIWLIPAVSGALMGLAFWSRRRTGSQMLSAVACSQPACWPSRPSPDGGVGQRLGPTRLRTSRLLGVRSVTSITPTTQLGMDRETR
jgi:hypothetical protein